MIRNLKIGSVLAALLAMSAFGASAAQAATSLDIGGSPTILTGSQATQNKLSITGAGGTVVATVKCTTASVTSTQTSLTLTEATLTPSYGTCELGGLAASVKVNGCTYTMETTVFFLRAQVSFVCPSKQFIEIAQGTCLITIGSQGPLEKITFANVAGSPKHVTATFNVEKISVFGGAGCPANLQGSHFADLTGTQTWKTFVDSSGVEGVQVSLEAT